MTYIFQKASLRYMLVDFSEWDIRNETRRCPDMTIQMSAGHWPLYWGDVSGYGAIEGFLVVDSLEDYASWARENMQSVSDGRGYTCLYMGEPSYREYGEFEAIEYFIENGGFHNEEV